MDDTEQQWRQAAIALANFGKAMAQWMAGVYHFAKKEFVEAVGREPRHTEELFSWFMNCYLEGHQHGTEETTPS